MWLNLACGQIVLLGTLWKCHLLVYSFQMSVPCILICQPPFLGCHLYHIKLNRLNLYFCQLLDHYILILPHFWRYRNVGFIVDYKGLKLSFWILLLMWKQFIGLWRKVFFVPHFYIMHFLNLMFRSSLCHISPESHTCGRTSFTSPFL